MCMQMWDSAPTLPYRISAQSCWRRAATIGYLSLDDSGKVLIDIMGSYLLLQTCHDQS